MNYPLISEYIEAIKSAEDNFKELNYLRPVLDDDGLPVMTSGNFAVVFKMKDEQSGKFYAVKCFTKEQEGRAENYKKITEYLDMSSRYLVPVKYLDNELFVDSNVTEAETFPVLLMDWIDGKTLDIFITEHLQYNYILENLAYSFSELSVWLRSIPIAHGDLKPDNIIVTTDGCKVSIHLVDYDGMFVPALRGKKAMENGTPNFRHPLRNMEEFDENIDDFSLVTIQLSLKIISKFPNLYRKYSTQDKLLFSEEDYRNIWGCSIIKDIFNKADKETIKLIGLLFIAIAENNISQVAPSYMRLSIPEFLYNEYSFDFKTYNGELWNSLWKDQYGARYSYDRKTIVKGANIENYYIRDRVIDIAPCAFADIEDTGGPFYISLNLYTGDMSTKNIFAKLEEVILPSSLEKISYYAFHGSSIKKIRIPSSVTFIDVNAFDSCKCLHKVILSTALQKIEDYTFSNCQSLTCITIPQSVTRIGKGAFRNCKKLEVLFLSSIVVIEKDSFDGCESLKEIRIPKGQNKYKYTRLMPLHLRNLVIETS